MPAITPHAIATVARLGQLLGELRMTIRNSATWQDDAPAGLRIVATHEAEPLLAGGYTLDVSPDGKTVTVTVWDKRGRERIRKEQCVVHPSQQFNWGEHLAIFFANMRPKVA